MYVVVCDIPDPGFHLTCGACSAFLYCRDGQRAERQHLLAGVHQNSKEIDYQGSTRLAPGLVRREMADVEVIGCRVLFPKTTPRVRRPPPYPS